MGEGVLVVGSINQDFVLEVERRPRPGETVTDAKLNILPGGKGANQAVAAAKAGASVALLGSVGDDALGESALADLRRSDVNVEYVYTTSKTPTGSAFITVTPDGENSIVVSPGANFQVRPEDIDGAEETIAEAGVVLLQMELTRHTVRRTLEIASRHDVRTSLPQRR